jgi:Uma2 family endonuclease
MMTMNVALTASKVPARMSVQQFLEWADATGGRWELVDGAPRAVTPPLLTHGSILGELAKLIGVHLDQHRPSWYLFIDPGIVPAMLPSINMRMPDLAVGQSPFGMDERALADAVLIAEILSPSNHADTWSNVWTYTSIPSVQEILVVHGSIVCAELLRRQPGGSWPAEPEEIAGGNLALDSIGFSLPIAAIYRKTPLARD